MRERRFLEEDNEAGTEAAVEVDMSLMRKMLNGKVEGSLEVVKWSSW